MPLQRASSALPRVLIVDASDRGGIALYSARLRAALEREHTPVQLAAPPGLGDPHVALRSLRWGPEVEKMSRPQLYAQRLRELGPSAWAVLRAVGRARPDVVHVQTEVVPGLDPAVLRVISRRVPVVLTIHDPVPLEGGARAAHDQARRWRAVDALIVHAEEPRLFVEASAPGVPVHVVPVDLVLGGAAVPKDKARARLGIGEGPVALLLGQVRPYKGIGLLAEAWPQVHAARPASRLFVVGEAYDSAELARLEDCAGVEVRRGFVADEEVDLWAAAADLLVLPYSVGSHSGILHRGLAMGTPVLASPPLAEEAYRTGAGQIVPLDPRAWADALAAALGDRPLPRPATPTGQGTARGTLAVYSAALSARRAGSAQQTPGDAHRRGRRRGPGSSR